MVSIVLRILEDILFAMRVTLPWGWWRIWTTQIGGTDSIYIYIYLAYFSGLNFREYPHNSYGQKYATFTYLHFRILKFPLKWTWIYDSQTVVICWIILKLSKWFMTSVADPFVDASTLGNSPIIITSRWLPGSGWVTSNSSYELVYKPHYL